MKVRGKFIKYTPLMVWIAVLSFTVGELMVRVASVFLPGVHYLVTVGDRAQLLNYKTLENFAKYHPNLTSYQNYHNYYNNAFGFNDTEFVEKKGGGLVDPNGLTYLDQPERFLGPNFSEEAYIRMMAKELGRLYNNPEEDIDKKFTPILEEIDRIRIMAENSDIPLIIVGHPSQLQVYPEKREKIIMKVKKLPLYQFLDSSKIDIKLPNRKLEKYSLLNGLPFIDLTDEFVKAALTNPFLYTKSDTHWNIYGNSIAAEIEAEA